MSLSTGFFIHAACLCLFVLKAQGSVPIRNTSSVFLSYSEYNSHTVYDACAWRGPGTLSFLFNTYKPDTFLAYQDDGTYSNFDLFLINGKIRARVTFDECPWEELVIEGNFSDSRWHRVRLTRELSNLTLMVDGCHSQTIPCDISSPEREKWEALYVGSIPLHISWNSLANPGIFREAIASGFQGCIGHVTQSVPGENPKPLPLRYSAGTGQACVSRCAFGEECGNHKDDVTGKVCECPGYGIKELICKRHASLASTHLAHAQTNKTSSSSGFISTQVFSTKFTPSLVSSSQTRYNSSTATSSLSIAESTRAQSSSHNTRVRAHHVDKGFLKNQPSSVPGISSGTKQYGSFPVPSGSITPVLPMSSSSVEVSFSSSVNNKVAAMAKKSSVFRLAGSGVVLFAGLLAAVQNNIMHK